MADFLLSLRSPAGFYAATQALGFLNPTPKPRLVLLRAPAALRSAFVAPDIAAQCAGQVPAALRSAFAGGGAPSGLLAALGALRSPREGGEPAMRFRLQCLQ